jgi:hypothetical protein
MRGEAKRSCGKIERLTNFLNRPAAKAASH